MATSHMATSPLRQRLRLVVVVVVVVVVVFTRTTALLATACCDRFLSSSDDGRKRQQGGGVLCQLPTRYLQSGLLLRTRTFRRSGRTDFTS